MTFIEFNEKCEIKLYAAIKEIMMQPKRVMTISEKQKAIAKTIYAYVEQYEKMTKKRADIYEVLEVMM